MEDIPSFIKIGGAVSEKKGRNGQTFVVLYIGFYLTFMISDPQTSLMVKPYP